MPDRWHNRRHPIAILLMPALAASLWLALTWPGLAQSPAGLDDARRQVTQYTSEITQAMATLVALDQTAELRWRELLAARDRAEPYFRRVVVSRARLNDLQTTDPPPVDSVAQQVTLRRDLSDAQAAAVTPGAELGRALQAYEQTVRNYRRTEQRLADLRIARVVARVQADLFYEPPTIKRVRVLRRDSRQAEPIVLYDASWSSNIVYEAIDRRVRALISAINGFRTMEARARQSLPPAEARLLGADARWQALNERYQHLVYGQMAAAFLLESIDVLNDARTAGPALGGYLVYQLGEKGLDFWKRVVENERTVDFPTLNDELLQLRDAAARGVDVRQAQLASLKSTADGIDLYFKKPRDDILDNEIDGWIQSFLEIPAEHITEQNAWPLLMSEMVWSQLNKQRATGLIELWKRGGSSVPNKAEILVNRFVSLLQSTPEPDAGEELKTLARQGFKLFKDKMVDALKAAGKTLVNSAAEHARFETFHLMALAEIDYLVERNRLHAIGEQIRTNRRFIVALERALENLLDVRASLPGARRLTRVDLPAAIDGIATSEWENYPEPPYAEISLNAPRETRLFIEIGEQRFDVYATGDTGPRRVAIPLRQPRPGAIVLAIGADQPPSGAITVLPDSNPATIATIGSDLTLRNYEPGDDRNHTLTLVKPMVDAVGALAGQPVRKESGEKIRLTYRGPPYGGGWIGIVAKDGPPLRDFAAGPSAQRIDGPNRGDTIELTVPTPPGNYVVAIFDREKDGAPIAWITMQVMPQLVVAGKCGELGFVGHWHTSWGPLSMREQNGRIVGEFTWGGIRGSIEGLQPQGPQGLAIRWRTEDGRSGNAVMFVVRSSGMRLVGDPERIALTIPLANWPVELTDRRPLQGFCVAEPMSAAALQGEWAGVEPSKCDGQDAGIIRASVRLQGDQLVATATAGNICVPAGTMLWRGRLRGLAIDGEIYLRLTTKGEGRLFPTQGGNVAIQVFDLDTIIAGAYRLRRVSR